MTSKTKSHHSVVYFVIDSPCLSVLYFVGTKGEPMWRQRATNLLRTLLESQQRPMGQDRARADDFQCSNGDVAELQRDSDIPPPPRPDQTEGSPQS
jgi:hypothetical protein